MTVLGRGGFVQLSVIVAKAAIYCAALKACSVLATWIPAFAGMTVVRIAVTENGLRCWHRSFVFEDGYRQLVQTTKLASVEHGMMDGVGAQGEKRLATKMRVWANGRSLFFQSTAHVFRLREMHLRIPMILTPGALFAEHRDLGDGSFRYILKFNHPLWGETFYQDGVFVQTEDGI